MFKIEEINEDIYNQQPENTKLIGTDQVQYFYKIVVHDTIDFFFEASFDSSRFIVEALVNIILLCADDRIIIFSNEGRILCALKVFEDIDFYRLVENHLFLFSEKLAYKFTTEYYSLYQIF